MLTGRLPFEGSVAALIFQIGSKPVAPPSQYRPDLDAGLEAVLLKALARQPEDRYPSVAEFAATLRAWRPVPAVAAPVRGASEARQRRLTLLACGCDLFDSEAILNTLDPEEQHELLLDFQQLCRDAAAPLAGTVVTATDDGLLLCFGVPAALECAARRAVRVGLTMLDRMAALNERLGRRHQGLHLSARLAVHSGRAVVTEGSRTGEALSIVGQVMPAVAQLKGLAAPETLVISDDTHRLLRGHVECTSLGAHALKGSAGAMPIYRVHRELASHCVGTTGASGLTPLIGRDREVALLEERWEQGADGVGQVVLLVGEAGIGKSRQVRVLREYVAEQRANSQAAVIIEWPCSNLTQNSSLAPVIECFNGVLGLTAPDDAARKLDILAAHLECLHLAGAETIALMASLLSIPLDGRYPALGMSPQRQKEKTFDLLLDWLGAKTLAQPVLLVVEDLHWADPVTVEFLDFLVGRVQGTRLLALLTFRPDFVPPWKSRGHQTQVSLSRLSRRQTAELMRLKSGLPTMPQTVVDQVADRSDGVPLFVEELTAMLLEAGSLRLVDGAVQVTDAFDVRAIPDTLQDLLLARLDRLASDLEVVQLAATIGREFNHDLLAAVAWCGESALCRELAKLVDAELLFQHGRPPNARYQFKHALIRDAAYQSLLKKKRQQFHARIAEVLEQRFPETCTAQPELLAHHFSEGNEIAKAVTYWLRAGEHAQQRGAPAEAAGHFSRALDLIRTLPESRERHVQEIQLLIGLGVALQVSKGYGVPEVEATYARAHALCQQTGLRARLFPVVYGRFRYCLQKPQLSRALELAEELAKLADQQPNTGFVVAAHYGLGAALFYQGKHAEALPHLEKVVSVGATPELRFALYCYDVVDPWVISQSHLSRSLWLLGFPQRAMDQSRQALSTADGLDHSFSLAVAVCLASWLHQFGKDWAGARATAARALTLGTEKGFAVLSSWARIVHGWTMAEIGQSEQGLAEIRQGLANLHTLGSNLARTYHLALLAEACARADRPKEGLQALTEAQQFASATGEGIWLAEIHRLTGELLLQHDATALQDAEACFHQALDVARRQQARSLELRAAMSLARLWHRQGKTRAAMEVLAPVYGAFTEGFDTPDLEAARALLKQ
jgi:class 3 adenylate cyclase/predicted ATPase